MHLLPKMSLLEITHRADDVDRQRQGIACDCNLKRQHYNESAACGCEFVAEPAAVNYSDKLSSIMTTAAAAAAAACTVHC